MPAIYHEGSWLGNATDPEVLVKDTVGWTGKNRLKNTASTVTKNGVTMTVNADKSVTFNGTPTGRTDFYITSEIDNYANILDANLIGENVITSVGTNVTFNVCEFGVHLIDSSKNRIMSANMDIPNGKEESSIVTIPSNAVYYDAYFVIDRGGSHTPLNNLTFHPMLRKADITDPTYEPYHESVEEEIEQIYADNGVLGAKNLLPNNVTSRTINGVTFTVNSDGSVTVNGTADPTATGNAWYPYYIGKMSAGKYLLNGCPTGGQETNGYFLFFRKDPDNASFRYYDTGNGVSIDIPNDDSTFICFICIWKGVTVNNLIFKPMIRLASDPDDTYQPYAMTNRELTEYAAVANVTSQIIAESQTHYTFDSISVVKSGSFALVSGVMNSVDVTAQPVGTPWVVLYSNLPHIKSDMFITTPAGRSATANPVQFKYTTDGHLLTRGGTTGDAYYFQLFGILS